MRIKLLVSFTVSLIILFSCIVLGEKAIPLNAGITPDSILYPFDKIAENINLVLKIREIDKAEAFRNEAKERLLESMEMMDEKNIELGKEALNEFFITIGEATKSLNNINVGKEIHSNKITEIADSILLLNDPAQKVIKRLPVGSQPKILEDLKSSIENIEIIKSVKTEEIQKTDFKEVWKEATSSFLPNNFIP